MSQVNLDALIPREDLFRAEGAKTEMPDIKSLRIDADLKPNSHFFKTLRKADFQRVTSEWKSERIAGLIKSFINDDIIPACILWRWEGYNFIIDGGHRLSALIAWINDDYGDGDISKAYFGSKITKEQQKNADKTRTLIKNDPEIGSFSKYEYAVNNPSLVSQEEMIKASNITVNRSIEVQWIKAKTSNEAELSFFKINGEATPIDETEAIILKSRKKPNGIAARAIMHAGSAHKYWKDFDAKTRETIEELAIKINSLLFEPPLDQNSTKFPCGGNEYANQSLEVVFSIINMINDLDDSNEKRKQLLKKKPEDILPPADIDGTQTISYLEKVKRTISIISGTGKEAISLGLSPVIYFYSARGRFQITSFLAIIYIASQWDEERKKGSNKFQQFCSIRNLFEEFLLQHKNFITQATINVGSGIKSYKRLAELFLFIIDNLLLRKSKEHILKEIQDHPKFGFIKIFYAENEYEAKRNQPGKKPPKETVIEIVINNYIASQMKCPICNGYATFDSYNIDHILEVRNGGKADLNNLQLTHFYCNEEKDMILKLKNS